MDTDLKLLTSIQVKAGRCSLLSLHLDRLQVDAEALGFALNRVLVMQRLIDTAERWTFDEPARIRVLVGRDGSLTVTPPEAVQSDAEPLRALLWPEPVLSRDPLLHHRTTPRPLYDAAYAAVRKAGFIDVLFQNELGMVTEGAIHNIFVNQAGEWKTPPLRAGVLPGIYRRHMLETRPNVREAEIPVSELLAAEEVYLTSAVQGLRRVSIVNAGEHPELLSD